MTRSTRPAYRSPALSRKPARLLTPQLIRGCYTTICAIPQRGSSPWEAQPDSRTMAEIIRILQAIDEGDRHAAEELLLLVYDAQRKLAMHRTA